MKEPLPITRLFVIDDEESTPFLYNRLFKVELGLGSMEIFYAKNGLAGIEHLKILPKVQWPHLVVLDLNMPGLSGLNVAAYLYDHYKEIPVIILTAYGDETNREQALKLGVREFLEKPTNIYELKSIILRYRADRCTDF